MARNSSLAPRLMVNGSKHFRRPARRKKFTQITRSWLGDPEIDAVVICLPKFFALPRWAGNLTDEIPQGLYFGRELNNCTIYGSKATVRLRPLTLFEDVEGKLVDQASSPQTKRILLNSKCKISSTRSPVPPRR